MGRSASNAARQFDISTREWHSSPLKTLKTAEIGEVRSIKIIPSEKICTPEPEKYSMMPCMGSDFAGLPSASGSERGERTSSRQGDVPCALHLQLGRFAVLPSDDIGGGGLGLKVSLHAACQA